jgi:hypothetical protein
VYDTQCFALVLGRGAAGSARCANATICAVAQLKARNVGSDELLAMMGKGTLHKIRRLARGQKQMQSSVEDDACGWQCRLVWCMHAPMVHLKGVLQVHGGENCFQADFYRPSNDSGLGAWLKCWPAQLLAMLSAVLVVTRFAAMLTAWTALFDQLGL